MDAVFGSSRRSCEVCQLAFLNLITSLRNEQQSVLVIYLNLSKASDKVRHRRLPVKLEALGIRPPLLDFIGSYLSNRSQMVLVVRKTLKQLQLIKSPGPDGISAKVLNELTDQLVSPLSNIFENSMEAGALPTEWKIANTMLSTMSSSSLTSTGVYKQ
ncbi:unnamed protein product [Schistocephalus solidus]|uniref:Reverse transcriptase domain-containing protein n=1 Tax=Schistocephalus solidus TaxID=70667 RepID=A0A183TQ80_SCHSO|nr:unnamed protein product [Schistocephalus solidus]